MIAVLLVYALLASTFTLGKMLLFFVPPIFLIGVRMSIAGMLLLGIHSYLYGLPRYTAIKPYAASFGALSLIHIFIPYVTEFTAMQYMAPSCVALVYNLSPFFAALFSYFYFDEVMTVKKWISFAIGLGGILFFAYPDIFCWSCCTGWESLVSVPYLLMFLSVVSSSLGWILVRGLVSEQNLSPLFVNGIAMFLGGVEALVASRYTHGAIDFPWENIGTFLLLLSVVILIANVLFFNLYGYLLKHYTATFLSFLGFTTPLFAALYDWLFLGLPVEWRFFVAVGIIGGAIYLFYSEELKQGYYH